MSNAFLFSVQLLRVIPKDCWYKNLDVSIWKSVRICNSHHIKNSMINNLQ